MKVRSVVVPLPAIDRAWGLIAEGVEVYRQSTPHDIGTAEEILQMLKAGENELLLFGSEGKYGGFATFKIHVLDGELVGTLAMIYVAPEFQNTDIMAVGCGQLAEHMKLRGCKVMNYFTKRKGFKRLAPKLGFQPRIIEWMKEL